MNEREVLELMRRVIECGDFVGRLGMLNEIERRLSALPAPDEKLGTLPPSKTLNECREVFRRVAKRGPCLSSPDLHGIAAVRDFLTLDEEAFRRNWGPRDEDDDEKCEGGECRHGFDAGGGERLTECEKHGGKTSAQPLTGGEGVLSWVPSAEELIQCARAANEVPRDPSEPISKNLLAQAEATRRLIASRAPRPAPQPSVEQGYGSIFAACADRLAWARWSGPDGSARPCSDMEAIRAVHALLDDHDCWKALAEKRRKEIEAMKPKPQPSVEEMAERLLNAQLKHYGLSPRAWAQVGEEERAYWLALARAALAPTNTPAASGGRDGVE